MFPKMEDTFKQNRMLVESRGHLFLDTEGLTCPFFLFFSFFEGKTKQKQTNATKQFK